MQRERRFCQHGKPDEGNVAFVGVWGFTEKTGLSTGSGDGSQNGAGTANAGSSQGGTSSGLPQTGGGRCKCGSLSCAGRLRRVAAVRALAV